MPGRKIRDEADARACLDDAASSGLRRAQWARVHGVDARSLNAWRVNLRRRDATPSVLQFVELVATEGGDVRTLRVRRNALEVEVPEDFDDDHLLRVLRVLAAC